MDRHKPNERWEYLNGRHVNICIDCGVDCGLQFGPRPDVAVARNVIRCRDCANIASKSWFSDES